MKSDPEDMWEELRNNMFDRPTLIGAHLSPIGEKLEDFLGKVDEAAEHLQEDLDHAGRKDDWVARQLIESAVANIRIAAELVAGAQQAIVSVFPT